jgi:SAM-dependent methyltransferase
MSATMTAAPAPSALVHHARCPLCGGEADAWLKDTRDLHYGIGGSWNYERCRDCAVVFLNPAPTEAFLANAYDDSYYSYQDFSPEPRWKRWVRRALCFDPGATGDPRFARPGRVLDIGCGSGQFLYRMKLAGWETHGVELSQKAALIGNEHYQLNIQAGTLSSARLPDAYFDYIRLNHSFEHIPDPLPTLARIHRYLAPEGLLFIGVPNVDGWQARRYGKHWWNLGPPVHPFNYSRRTLTRLLEQQGFEVVRFRTNSNFAGMLGSMQMARNDRAGVYRDSGALFSNPVAMLLSQWLAKLGDLFSAGDCLEIIARKRPRDGAPHG